MATLTPVNYDPEPLEFAKDLSTTEGTIYTAPASEAGVKVTHVTVCNKTATAVLFRLAYRDVNNDFLDGANTDYYMAYDAEIPADGFPVVFDIGITLKSSAAPAALRAKASAAASLDVCIFGILMKDT